MEPHHFMPSAQKLDIKKIRLHTLDNNFYQTESHHKKISTFVLSYVLPYNRGGKEGPKDGATIERFIRSRSSIKK
jgi:hypothetical protein